VAKEVTTGKNAAMNPNVIFFYFMIFAFYAWF